MYGSPAGMVWSRDARGVLRLWTADWGSKLALACSAYVLLGVVWVLMGWSGDLHGKRLCFAAFLPLGLPLMLLVWRASRIATLPPQARRAWRIIALVVLLRSLGHWLSLYYEYVLGARPDGTWAEAPYLAYYPILLCGVLLFPGRARSRKAWLTFALDASTVWLTAVLALWYFFLQPLAAAGQKSVVASMVALAYPVGDLVLIFGIIVMVWRCPQASLRGALALLLWAILLNAIGDLAYGYMMLKGGDGNGNWVTQLYIVYFVSFYLMGLSGQWQYWQATRPPKVAAPVLRERSISVWMPYLSVALGYGLLLVVIYRHWHTRETESLLALSLGTLTLTALVIARQIASARENARLLAARATRLNQKRFRTLVQNSSDAIMIVDADTAIRFESPSVARILGYNPRELLGLQLTTLLHPDDLPRAQSFFAEVAGQAGVTAPIEWCWRRGDGSWLHVESVVTNLTREPNVRGIVINSRDITERKHLEAQLIQQSFHDPLTGLANRVLFRDRVKLALATAQNKGQTVAVLLIDVDNFKTINDSLGHLAGDGLLLTLAERLCGCLRVGDMVARLGGDEFAVLVENVNEAADVVDVVERIIEVLGRPIFLKGKKVFMGLSIGIAVSDSAGESTDALLRNADVAMYAAKRGGKGRYEIFQPDMHLAALERLELESALRHALEHEEFTLRYQPIVELVSGQLVGVEALLRWHHPQRGWIAPDLFIPLAEETGLIVPLGNWVLEQACRRCRAWQQSHPQYADLFVTVNLSGRQLQQAELAATVRSALAASGLDARSLVLEMTESAVIQDAPAALSRLTELKGLGVQLALDDFGTGYSSLSYLQRFPIDVLKIDKSFIVGIDQNGEDSLLVQAIIKLGEKLRLRIIAEGIEYEVQRERLQDLGCDLGQGYHFAQPLRAEEVDELLQQAESFRRLSERGDELGSVMYLGLGAAKYPS